MVHERFATHGAKFLRLSPQAGGRRGRKTIADLRPFLGPRIAAPAMPPSITTTHRHLKITLIALALVVNGLVISVVGYSLHLSRSQYEQRAELLTQNLSAAVDRNVSASIEKIDLALLGMVDELEEQLAAGGIDDERSMQFLKRHAPRYAEIESIRVTDDAGRAWLGPGNSRAQPLDLSTREWFQFQRARPDAGLYATKPIQSRATGGWIISFSRRYVRPDGSFAGAVTAAVPVEYFARLLSSIDLGKKGTIVIRDSELGLVARAPAIVNGQAGTVGNATVPAELRALHESGAMHGTVQVRLTSDGVERKATFRRLRVAPLRVVVAISSEEYLQGWWTELATLLAFSLAFAVITGGAGVFLFRAFLGRSQAEARTRLLANVFQHNGEAIMITDHRNRIIEINDRFSQLTGHALIDWQGRDPRALAAPQTSARALRAIRRAVRKEGRWQGEVLGQHKLGHRVPTWLTVAVMRDASARVTHHIISFSDMTVLKQAEERMLHMANHDALTRLPNRASLQGRLEQAVASARRAGCQLAVLFIDLDRFKNINDTLGHAVGDELLVIVAQRLKAIVRDSDAVARLGGDEFVVVLTDLPAPAAQPAALVAAKLTEELGRAYAVLGHVIHSTPSIGIAVFPDDGADGALLMKNADAAMYHAKSAGRNNFQFFTQHMNDAAVERLELENGLRRAIANGEFRLHYQPQIDLATQEVVGVEALVRWQHPELGLVAPLKFIALAEETGLIVPIGEWVLGEALRQLAEWRKRGMTHLRVAVNISAHQLGVADFAGMLLAKLQAQDLPAAALELEITEMVAMQRPEQTAVLLRELRRLGVALAIDDFGTGYSSLSHLKQLPLTRLKLDRSFVSDIEHDANDAAICAATISLAHNLGLGVVAEGVETAEQLNFLRSLDCDGVQGYLFSKPLPAQECAAFIEARQSIAA